MNDPKVENNGAPHAAATPAGGRIPELDALRGIAALGVVVWHYGVHFGATPLELPLLPFYNAGFLFVDFFFVLSGYVISRAFWREPRQSRLGANILARIARMYPLHLAMLLLVAALLACLPAASTNPDFNQANNDLKHFLLNLLLLNQSGLQEGWSFNTPAWSISAELIVNVVFLAFIFMRPRARIGCATLVAAAVIGLALFRSRPYIQDQFVFGWLDVNLVRCGLGFLAGVVAYWLIHRLGFARTLAAAPRSSTFLGAASLLALGTTMIVSGRHPPIAHYLASIAMATGCVVFVPFAPLLRHLLRHRMLTYLGDISYSIYLTHYPLQLAVYLAGALGLVVLDFDSAPTLLAFVAAVIALSAASHRYIEMPAQKWLLELGPRRAVPSLS